VGSLFYLPDVANLPNAADALRGVNVYIGDGATIVRSMVRKKNGTMVGHAPVTTQLGWCAKAHVPRAIFTHCGSPVVRGDARPLNALMRRIGREHGIAASLARDGDRMALADDASRLTIAPHMPRRGHT
jgi:hypothetical protein